MRSSHLISALKRVADPAKAKLLARFFKTGRGEYGEGDVFIGVMVPEQRKIAQQFITLPLDEIAPLIRDPRHEVRLTGLLILEYKVKRRDVDRRTRREVFDFYLSHSAHIDNWDLVDVTARDIVGAYLYDFKKSRRILYRLAQSENIWERRIAIVATSYFIGKNDFVDTLKIAEHFLNDTHDLIHKATGWMLREVGKRDVGVLRAFLDAHAAHMPRTMLRYSLEKFAPRERRRYMAMIDVPPRSPRS